MSEKTYNLVHGAILIAYLLVVAFAVTAILIINFPSIVEDVVAFPNTDGEGSAILLPFNLPITTDQGLLLLAFTAGIAGSFLHAAQSLATYLGNVEFKRSWTAWYLLRPWIGGILGLAVYFVMRAGLVAGASAVNPYGVVALGLLGGWFSKVTTDKLQEIFETTFKTDEDEKRKHKLHSAERPSIDRIDPTPVPSGVTEIAVDGSGFLDGAKVFVDGYEMPVTSAGDGHLQVSLDQLPRRPASGATALIQVVNPEGANPLSARTELPFQ